MRYYDWLFDPCRRWPASTRFHEAGSALICAALVYGVVKNLNTGSVRWRTMEFGRERDPGMFYFLIGARAALALLFGWAAFASYTRLPC